jgi:signal transduction histidine kinase
VVAHHMSVIAIQAEAAPYRVPHPPPELTRSFGTIRANALEALTELRRVLGLLRPDSSPDGGANAGAADEPQPGLDRLDDLLANGRAAGLTVTAAVSGPPCPLPPSVQLSAYRILQEALSNAMWHAPGAEVRIDVRYRDDGVELRVVNGPPRPEPAALAVTAPRTDRITLGHGLLGMREWATMLGGELVAGPAPDGGFAVSAVLPASGDSPR